MTWQVEAALKVKTCPYFSVIGKEFKEYWDIWGNSLLIESNVDTVYLFTTRKSVQKKNAQTY